MALEMEEANASEVRVPTGAGEEPICMVAEWIWGRQFEIKVQVPTPN